MAGRQISVVFGRSVSAGSVTVVHGKLGGLAWSGAGGKVVSDKTFSVSQAAAGRLIVTIDDAMESIGANATRVTVRVGDEEGFTVLLRDVVASGWVVVPTVKAAVTSMTNDERMYEAMLAAVRASGGQTAAERVESRPEMTFERACAESRDMQAPVWLGVPGDMRIFRFETCELEGYVGAVSVWNHSFAVMPKELRGACARYGFTLGVGEKHRVDIRSWLEDGALPIVHSETMEGDVRYELVLFASQEGEGLSAGSVAGTPWETAYAFVGGHMMEKEEHEAVVQAWQEKGCNEGVSPICVMRTTITNSGFVPRYAWVRAPFLTCRPESTVPSPGENDAYVSDTGLGTFGPDRVYLSAKIDGRPMPQREMALLLQPKQSIRVDFVMSHSPVDRQRGAAMAAIDIDGHLWACRAYWRAMLGRGATIRVPEVAIDERIRSGLQHLRMNSIGAEPNGPLLATVGNYAPIGSESSPMIQFFDSMGWHDIAERCIEFFLKRQKPDGMIQNFSGYELETGPVLWTMGEHFRYTRDVAWVKRVKEPMLRACECLLSWRKRNSVGDPASVGYGLLDGRVADPEDRPHEYMMNGLAVLGLLRAVEMLLAIGDVKNASAIERETLALRDDLVRSAMKSLVDGAVVPMGDGTWMPTMSPFPEYAGLTGLCIEGGEWWTHGLFGARDSIIGPLYLLLSEVIDARSSAGECLLRTMQELFMVDNAAFSQPYYCRQDVGFVARGEVKQFLSMYYLQSAALQDRQLRTFWEHYHHVSSQKTHEEAWFLMQTRWMLYAELGEDRLGVLRMVPRAWLKDGAEIYVRGAKSRFGSVDIAVRSHVDEGWIEAEVSCGVDRGLRTVEVRLPHPHEVRPRRVVGGTYDAASETVIVENFAGKAVVRVEF